MTEIPPTRTARLLPSIVTCPRCGMPVWEPRLLLDRCPTCAVLDSREPVRTDVR